MLFGVFSWLSWKATRNSHQFAAVVGALTAWNFGEWAAAVRNRHDRAKGQAPSGPAVARRLATLAVLTVGCVLVGSGRYFSWVGEGRTVGLGEARLWFPHEATKFAGRPGMPERFVVYHNGLAGLFVYYNGPGQKLYADARLEVVGPELYARYQALGRMIGEGRPGWQARLASLGDPGLIVDLLQDGSHGIAAHLLADPGHACVWFDPMAAVFLPRTGRLPVEPVDFRAMHFDGPSDGRARAADEEVALARASVRLLKELVGRMSPPRPDLYRPLQLLGLGAVHRAIRSDRADAEAWRRLGELQTLVWLVGGAQEGAGGPKARIGRPYDPLADLAVVRATYALGEADRLNPDEPNVVQALANLDKIRGLDEESLPLLERLARMPTGNVEQARTREEARLALPALRESLGPSPSTNWRNLGELETAVARLLARGRVASAARLLEAAYEPRSRSWEVADRIATLWLQVGEPSKARAAWESASEVPRPGLQAARIALTKFVEADFEAARRGYESALAAEPDLFDASYELAILEAEDGRRAEALDAARRAERSVPTDAARSVASELLRWIEPDGRAVEAD